MANAVQCPGCGQEQDVPDELAGLWSRCPACSADIPPAPAPAGAASPASDDVPWHGAPPEPTPEEQPVKEPEEADPELEFATKWEDRLIPATVPIPFLRRRRRLPGWLRGVLVLTFVLMLIVPAWLFTRWLTAPKLGRTAEGLLPDQTESLLIIDVPTLRKSDAYWTLLKSAPQLLVALQRMPVPPENINRLILAETGDGSVLTIIQAKEPLKGEQLKQRIKADNLVQEEVGRYVVHCDARGRGLCIVQSDLIVIAHLSMLRQVLLRSQPLLSPAMRQGVDQLDLTHTVVLLATPQARAAARLPGSSQIHRLALAIDVSAQVDVAATVECQQAKDAEELAARIRALAELTRQELPASKETDALTRGLHLTVNGGTLNGELHIDADTFVTALAHVLGLRTP